MPSRADLSHLAFVVLEQLQVGISHLVDRLQQDHVADMCITGGNIPVGVLVAEQFFDNMPSNTQRRGSRGKGMPQALAGAEVCWDTPGANQHPAGGIQPLPLLTDVVGENPDVVPFGHFFQHGHQHVGQGNDLVLVGFVVLQFGFLLGKADIFPTDSDAPPPYNFIGQDLFQNNALLCKGFCRKQPVKRVGGVFRGLLPLAINQLSQGVGLGYTRPKPLRSRE